MNSHALVDRVLRYILRVPDRDFAHLTTKLLAERFAVSRCHLSRSFRLDRNMTLATFIQRQKLLRAERQLLKNKHMTVRALGRQLGYADYQYFIARFREHWGASPARYRKLLEESSALNLKKYPELSR